MSDYNGYLLSLRRNSADHDTVKNIVGPYLRRDQYQGKD